MGTWSKELADKYLPGLPEEVTDEVFIEADGRSSVGGAGSTEQEYADLAHFVLLGVKAERGEVS